MKFTTAHVGCKVVRYTGPDTKPKLGVLRSIGTNGTVSVLYRNNVTYTKENNGNPHLGLYINGKDLI